MLYINNDIRLKDWNIEAVATVTATMIIFLITIYIQVRL